MWTLFPRMSGSRAHASALVALVAVLAVPSACNYGFYGGGLPSDVETIYIEPFENRTSEFEIEQQLFSRLTDRIPSALGVSLASADRADAILRGAITSYDDVAQNYRRGQREGDVDVLQHEVQIGLSAELVNTRENVILWESSSVSGRGAYAPETQTDADGREEAISQLVQEMIDGAQSQW